ncbi:hypothetical protein BDV35DRAFT_260018 [Aspergillus flavus]|uniref:Zn(2)-C6 fungal-type domain-containing protein n=1 Tax=Aspergillus flavus TaxID=5059 RepID=A0A5N6GXY4_ASPFL|nr:hypothetical protein BDV35DRAFT_260018 [Aspergillus flavus]
MRKKWCPKRSTTGCRTCRARRVNCDEAPGACKRCINAGWKCEGYDFARLSNLGRDDRGIISSLTLYRVSQGLPGVSPEEKRGFAFFQHLTIPNLTGFFNTSLWSDVVFP